MALPILKPCPFCGGEAHLEHPPHEFLGYDKGWSVNCPNCSLFFGYDSQYGGQFPHLEDAADAWNKRAEPKQP